MKNEIVPCSSCLNLEDLVFIMERKNKSAFHLHFRYDVVKRIRSAIVTSLQPFLGDLVDRTDSHVVSDLVAKFTATQQFVHYHSRTID